MGQQVSITELKEQIEAAKRSLAEMPQLTTAVDPLLQPVATPAALNQNMVANDDMAADDMAADDAAKGEDFQFFHRPKRSDRPFAPSSPMSMANTDISACGDGQSLFQGLDQRLAQLEDDIAQNRKHILELITLLSGLDMAAKPTRRSSTSTKSLLRLNLYWVVIGFLVISWVALTPSGHYWINHFWGLI